MMKLHSNSENSHPGKLPWPRRLRSAKALAWMFNLVLLAIAIPLASHAWQRPIQFNQFWIQQLEIKHRTISAPMLRDFFVSAYSSGIDHLVRQPDARFPNYEDDEAVFSYIFSWLPTQAQVYPTEGFYYFQTRDGDADITGNLRLADLDKGMLTLSYFKSGNRDEQEVRISEYSPLEGLQIEQEKPSEYRVTYKGKSTTFVISDLWKRPPSTTPLLEAEEFIGQIHDESGIVLFLLYNNETKSFYEVLNEEYGVTDRFDPTGHPNCVIGQRTGFVFYQDEDYGRKILVGVDFGNVLLNNFYDGPFDQVPIFADLGDKLYTTYPSTLLGNGTDRHGVWQSSGMWSRFVVGPYYQYPDLKRLEEEVFERETRNQSKSMLWTSLTKEWWYTDRWLNSTIDRLAKEGKHAPGGDPLKSLNYRITGIGTADHDDSGTPES